MDALIPYTLCLPMLSPLPQASLRMLTIRLTLQTQFASPPAKGHLYVLLLISGHMPTYDLITPPPLPCFI